jgi:hypothetical protein
MKVQEARDLVDDLLQASLDFEISPGFSDEKRKQYRAIYDRVVEALTNDANDK